MGECGINTEAAIAIMKNQKMKFDQPKMANDKDKKNGEQEDSANDKLLLIRRSNIFLVIN